MKNKTTPLLTVSIAALLLTLGGCATTEVFFTVKRPAQISMRGVKRMAMGNFTGNNAAHVNKLIARLESSMIDSKAFEGVIDRKHMADVLKEHNIQLTGMFNEKSVAQIGKFIAAAGIIYASIDDDGYTETLTEKMVVTAKTNIDKKNPKDKSTWVTNITVFSNMMHTRTGTYTLNITYQVVDIEKATLAAVRPMNIKRKFVKIGKDEVPEAIDKEEAFATTLAESCYSFVRMITPSYVNVRADFMRDNELPEVDLAVKNIRSDLMPEGIEMLKNMLGKGTKTEIQAKTYYNYGLALVFNGEYDYAMENIRKALSMNPDEQAYRNGMALVKSEKENSEKLKEQEQ
ncbi:MAG: tetratricopeptide repeat protein [Spirochaetota bacterium]